MPELNSDVLKVGQKFDKKVKIDSTIYNRAADKKNSKSIFEMVEEEFENQAGAQTVFRAHDCRTFEDMIQLKKDFVNRGEVAPKTAVEFIAEGHGIDLRDNALTVSRVAEGELETLWPYLAITMTKYEKVLNSPLSKWVTTRIPTNTGAIKKISIDQPDGSTMRAKGADRYFMHIKASESYANMKTFDIGFRMDYMDYRGMPLTIFRETLTKAYRKMENDKFLHLIDIAYNGDGDTIAAVATVKTTATTDVIVAEDINKLALALPNGYKPTVGVGGTDAVLLYANAFTAMTNPIDQIKASGLTPVPIDRWDDTQIPDDRILVCDPTCAFLELYDDNMTFTEEWTDHNKSEKLFSMVERMDFDKIDNDALAVLDITH